MFGNSEERKTVEVGILHCYAFFPKWKRYLGSAQKEMYATLRSKYQDVPEDEFLEILDEMSEVILETIAVWLDDYSKKIKRPLSSISEEAQCCYSKETWERVVKANKLYLSVIFDKIREFPK